MNISKYCMDGSDQFVIINKNSGLKHTELALLLVDEPVSAGFIMESGGQLIAYGQSTTLDLVSRDLDTQIINSALEEHLMRSMWDDITDHWVVGNITHLTMGDIESFESLQNKRIL